MVGVARDMGSVPSHCASPMIATAFFFALIAPDVGLREDARMSLPKVRKVSTVASGAATLHLAPHGKRMVAESMYAKGKAFLAAALLLRQKGGEEYVVLHLLCQGIEVTLKGLLLAVDYDTFKPKLRKFGKFGHDLVAVIDAGTTAAGLPSLGPIARMELETLNKLYSPNFLRYGSGYDILVDPRTIPSDQVLRHMMKVLRFIERKKIMQGFTI
jgi:hypothetical protein